MPEEKVPVLLPCGPITVTDFSLMLGLDGIANGGRQINTSHRSGLDAKIFS